MPAASRPCGHYDGRRTCGAPDARLFLAGWRCAAHTPARLAGKPEPGRSAYCAPARCYCGGCR